MQILQKIYLYSYYTIIKISRSLKMVRIGSIHFQTCHADVETCFLIGQHIWPTATYPAKTEWFLRASPNAGQQWVVGKPRMWVWERRLKTKSCRLQAAVLSDVDLGLRHLVFGIQHEDVWMDGAIAHQSSDRVTLIVSWKTSNEARQETIIFIFIYNRIRRFFSLSWMMWRRPWWYGFPHHVHQTS